MSISGIGASGVPLALNEAVQMIKNAEFKLLRATAEINTGDIVDAAILVQQGKFEAKAAAAIVRAADDISESVIDILA